MEILRAVIHGFDKDQHTVDVDPKKVVKKDVLLDIRLDAVVNLIEGLAKVLGKRTNAQSWGRFDNERGGPFPQLFKRNAGNWDVDESFLALTHLAVDELVKQAKLRPTSTGSHLLFAQYRTDDQATHFLVAMIKQKGGIQLDKNFVPISITEIDMAKLHQAADIRIEEYHRIAADEAAMEELPDELENYLSFLSQRDSGEASGYFISALGCIVGLTPRKATSSILTATDKFFDSKPEIKSHKKAAREALCKYLTEKSAAGENATLSDIQQIITAILPVDLKPLTEEMESYYNGPEYKIPADFSVHTTELRKFTRISLVSNEIEIKVRRSIIGTQENSRVYFNKEGRSLTINNLTEAEVAHLAKELE